jgi:hypothetical protein
MPLSATDTHMRRVYERVLEDAKLPQDIVGRTLIGTVTLHDDAENINVAFSGTVLGVECPNRGAIRMYISTPCLRDSVIHSLALRGSSWIGSDIGDWKIELLGRQEEICHIRVLGDGDEPAS